MLRFLRGFIKESRDLKAIKRMGRSFMSCCEKLLERNVIKINWRIYSPIDFAITKTVGRPRGTEK